MSKQRQIRRSNEKLKNKQSEIIAEKRPHLARRIISAVTAMGIFANPLAASAQILAGADFTKVTSNGSVIDIETKKIIDRTGVNIFKEFDLNANQIANMYFGDKANSNQADNLVNFVNSHIDVNGTVNAIRDNKIGGNLYFLSKDGMAVGSSGVINTGALHVMTPTAAQMTAMQNVLSTGTTENQKAQLELLRNSPAQIPLNPSGTITVLGKVNATNKIDLRAANILVGIDGSGVVDKTAALRTGVVDFTDLVNIKGNGGDIQSGLTGNLTATMDAGSGDIILKASADAGTKTLADGAPDFIKDKLDGLADEFTYRDISATVKNYGTIDAAGGVEISATAANGKRTDTTDADPGSLAKVTAAVDLAGNVSGAKDVKVSASAKNEYVDEDGLVHKASVLGLGAATPLTGDVAFAVLDTAATVNIGSEATVKSSNGNVSVSAESTTLAATQASATGYKYASLGGQKGTYVPAGAVVYTEASNKATVNVDGKLTAAGDVDVAAKADLKIDAVDNLAVKGGNANQVVVGVMVTNGDNAAQVNINKNQAAGYEQALTAGKDVNVKAEALNDLNSEENVSGADASALVTAVNVTNYNSSAGVNVDRSLLAGNDLNVSAADTFTNNTVSSNNKIGSGKYVVKATETLEQVGATDAMKAVGGKIKDALFKKDGDQGGEELTYEGIKLSDFLKAGATVAVVNEKNNASVNIGSEAGLTAQTGQITLDAKMQMDDIHMTASGASNSYTKEQGGGIVGNASVLVTNLENQATVTVADRSDAKLADAAISGAKGVTINSQVKIDYNRVQKMIDAVKDAAANIEAGFSGLGGSISSDWQNLLDAVKAKAKALEAAVGTFSADETLLTSDDGILEAAGPFTAAKELLAALDTLNEQIAAAEKDPAQQTTAAQLKQAVSGLSDVVVNAVAFADPNNYANFGAVSNAKGDDGSGQGTGTQATVAGTVMVTNVKNNSKVLLGNNVKIDSQGTVEVGAENMMKDVSLAGVTASIFNNAGGNSSMGATVNIGNFDTNTVAAVGEGSQISGGEINITGSNTIDHVAVAASAGKGASGESGGSGVTLNGMVSVISGDSKVLTIVDDEASLTASKNSSGADTTSGTVTISGHNDTSLVNVAGGLAMTESNGAVGAAVAVNDFAVQNIAGVGDVYGFSAEIFGEDNDELTGGDGYTTAYTATGDQKKAAAITAYGLNVEAVTDGTINTVSVAGSVSKNDSSGEQGFFGKLGDKMNGLTDKVLGKDGLVGKAGSIFADKLNGDGSSSSAVDDAFNANGTEQGGGQLHINRDNQGGGNGAMPEFSIAGSGSVSVNSLDNATKAVVDNAVITLNDGDLSVVGKDNAFVGAYSGAAAIVWKSSGDSGAQGKSAALAGAAAVNDLDNTISAVIANSNISNAGKIDVLGLSGGTTIAAGLGMEISKNEGGSGTGGAAVSVNLIDRTVNALMEDNTVDKAEAIDVTGYQSDVQVTGGMQVAAGNQGKALGASVAVASLNNTVNAGIKGTGDTGAAYTDIGNVEVHALTALTAVTAAVSAGATKTSSSDGVSVDIQGAGVYNGVSNQVNAYIDSAKIQTVENGSVRVRAMDTNTKDAGVYQELLTKGASSKEQELAKTSSLIDTKGNSYYDGLDTSMTDDGTGDGTLDMNSVGSHGSTIVTAAAGVAVTNGDAAVGASVAVSDIQNNFTAKITDSAITAENVEAQANSDTLLVGVAGGVAVGNKLGGIGNVSWQNIDNAATATISGSEIEAQNVGARAVNTAAMINVAGQIAGGKSAVGAGLGYSGLSNVTGAYLRDNVIDKRAADTDGVNVYANAANGNKMYTVGASLAAATEGAAITGTVVLTRADGQTDAVISDSQIDNAQQVDVKAADTTYTYTVMGNVAAGSKVGVGAGVAYTDIGGSSGDPDKAGQITRAQIKNTKIATQDAAAVNVSASDSSKVLNVAVGVGGAGNVAVQGAASTALINKQTQASIEATDIDKDEADAAKASVTVQADADSKIFNTAVVAAGAGTVAVGAGVAVNRVVQQTEAEVLGGTMNIRGLDVRAAAAPRIETIGVGGAIGGNVGVTGSVAVNMIKNDAAAHIGSGAVITADGSVGVVAQSDEQIANYAGSVSGGGTAAVGVSTSVNQISGTTSASIGESGADKTQVTARGNDSGITTYGSVTDGQIYDTLIDDETVAINSHIERTQSTQKGIVVDASSTRDLKSFLVNASGGMYAGVAATVNVNMIEGATSAKITNAVLNGGLSGSGSRADVSVRAGDYSNSSGFVGSAGIGIEGAGIGAGSDTNTVSRNVTAEVDDSEIRVQALKIQAEGKQGISSFTIGAGVAGIGAGVAGVVTVSEINSKTKAALSASDADVTTLDVGANHLARTNAGNISVGGAAVGAGVGLSVGVLKDDSDTEAVIANSEVTSSGDQKLTATNKTTVTSGITATGIAGLGAGVAGAVSVNNINGRVSTDISDSALTSTGGAITSAAKNTIGLDAYTGGNAGGVGGVGASVTVNTIDSTVQSNVTNSHLAAAKDITVTAEEIRDISQLATNAAVGGAAVGGNIIITNAGKALDAGDENERAALAQLDEANGVYGETDMLGFAGSLGALKKGGINAGSDTVAVGAGKGGGKDSQISANINGGRLTAQGKLAVTAKETDNISMTGGSGSLGAAAVNAGVGIVNVNRNLAVNINNTRLSGTEIKAGSEINGKTQLDMYQGSGGLLGVNAAYGRVSTAGTNTVNISGSTLTATKKDVAVIAADSSSASVNAVGLTAGVAAAGVIVGQAENSSALNIKVDGSDLTAEENVEINAERKARNADGSEKAYSLEASAMAGSGGLVFAGAGVSAQASENGEVNIAVTSGNNLTAGKAVDIAALNAPAVKAVTGALSGSLLASAAVTVAQANIGTEAKHLKTSVTIGDNNVLAAETISVKAETNAKQDVEMQALSISASPFPGGAAQINSGGSSIYSDVTVDAGSNVYRGRDLGENNYGAADLLLEAGNSVSQKVRASGISAGTAFATGTNLAATQAVLTTKVTAAGSKAGSHINDLTVNAKSYAAIDSEANGYGGALIDISPYAAKVENEYRADTDVELSGDWTTDGAVTAGAINGSDIDLHADAVRAAVVGGSGVWLKNDVSNAANVAVKDAQITSNGAQVYTAQNNVDHTGKIDASGYGGVNVNASDLNDAFAFTAGVTVDESELTALGNSGSITAQALTQGTVNSTNSLKSAGVIPVSLAASKHKLVYDNSVDITGSTLKTAKKDQDITLAASDDTEVRLETIADTQGGAVGAASARAENELARSNKLKVDGNSYLESTNDVNLYAGANSGGIDSSLDLEVLADAYNKTAIPVYTDPSVKNTMMQNNQVEIAGDVGSVRHVNVKAGKGKTTVTESAREYNIYTGTGGSGSVASTALGENISSETADNHVNVTGSVKSGIHNKLEVDISGATAITPPTYDDNGNMLTPGSVSYGDITITVGEGADWFDKDGITPAAMIIGNGLLARYKEVSGVMQEYQKDSDEYKAYKNELSNIVLEMRKAGMVALDKDGNQTDIPVDQINVAAIRLPDIVVSGGNINIDTDKLQGSGKLTAQGAPQLKVTNSSDLYLAVGDLTIKDAGGQLKFNGSDLKNTSSGNSFTGTVKADGLSTETPKITVNSNSPSAFTDNPSPQADIGIFGNITNTAGDIIINNDHYNVLVQGNISGRNITLSAVNGSVTQTSSEGLVNIGGDPVTRYQFSDSVAKKIQDYLYKLGEGKTFTFNSYDEYVNWLVDTVGINRSELNYTPDESAGIVAGDNVYISGLNVNIGGLVQSGYGNYSTELSAADAGKVAALDASWAASQRPLSDNEVMGNDAYCINGGGKVWNSTTKVWDYEVKVYYNPSTKQLLTDSITPNGGKIYITGKISSTGNGRLMAMDGAAEIGINTVGVDRTVKVNTITNNDISGLISITDKNTNKVTEYMNGQQRSYAVGTVADDLPAWSAGGSSYTYDPQSGLQYQWTGGVSGETTKKYSYSEKFLFWGLLDYSNTGEFVAGLDRDGKKYEFTTTSGDGQNLATGSIITTGNQGTQFTISSSHYTTNEEKFSEVTADKRYDGTAGKIFGYGTTYYYWTGKQGTASTSTSSLKADYGISIGFLGDGNGSGNINVTSKNDMILAGNISNATVIDNNGNYKGLGNVTLNSNQGSVTALGNAKINSDDVRITANTGIQVNHAAIGGSASVNAATNNGNISFISDKGDLNIVRLMTGGNNAIKAETGNIYLQADGDILDAGSGGYTVKGQRIDLVSNTGGIGTKDKALKVLGGSELFSGDSMTSSINASAQGDIVLTQTDGNMRLGTIESANGDAVLTVANGSFVDAYNEDSVGLSDSAAKVDRWLENGLISSADADDSNSKAAEKAKEERLSGLDSRAEALAGGDTGKVQAYKDAAQAYADDAGLQAARAAYIEAMQKADGISDATEKNAAITAAYSEYQQAQQDYFAGAGYNADEQNLIASYAEVSTSDNYGWSKNQLLYAIQESVINSKPGQVQTVDKANVTANNITLNAANGGIGVDAADKVISYDELGKLENLQLLASAKAGDLTWNAETNTVTFRQQRAINLQTRDQGEIHAAGRDNVYLAGTKDTVFNIAGIKTERDIKLMSDNGVHMIGNGRLEGENLIIYGGNGSIGSADKHIETKISGTLDANSAKSVYLTQQDGVLTIQAVAAGGEVVLDADDGMKMSAEEGKDMGYISAGTQITLTAVKGSIGVDGNGVRILNNGAVINADAGQDIYLDGRESGNLVVGTIRTDGTFTLNSAGNVSLGRAEEQDNEGIVTVTGVKGQVTAENNGVIKAVNIALDHGGVTINGAAGNLLLQAEGNITQNAAAEGIKSTSLTAVTGGGQKLLSQNNEISNFSAQSIGQNNSINGGIEFVSKAAGGLTAQLNGLNVNAGNVSISNIAADGELTINGGVNVTAGGIDFSGRGDLATTGVLKAAEAVEMTADGNISNRDAITAGKDIDLQAGKDITNNEAVSGGTDLLMEAKDGSIINKGAVSADADVSLTAAKSITNSSTVQAGEGLLMKAVTGNIINQGSVTAGKDIDLQAGKDITNNEAVSVGTDLLMEAKDGSIINKGAVSADADVSLTAAKSITNAADVSAAKVISMLAQAGDILNEGNLTAGGTGLAIDLTAGQGSISNTAAAGAVNAAGTVQMQAAEDIINKAEVNSGTGYDVVMDAGNDLVNSGAVDSGQQVLLTAGQDIGNTGKITAQDAITMEAGNDISNDGSLTAVQDVALTAAAGNINTGSNGAIHSEQGSISLATQNTAAAGQGDINVGAALTAQKHITIRTELGNVFMGADAAAQDGVLSVHAVNGDIRSSHFDGGDNPAGTDVKLSSINGSVDVYTQKGDVDLHEIYAKDKASAGTENGHLRLCKIDGNIVVLITKDMDNNMDVKEIVAGNQLIVSGNHITLDDIKQRDDADGMLIISPGGAKDDEPIGDFTIKNINTSNGVRFDKLWVRNANLHVESGRFYIDKLAVADVAYFSNSDMRTSVYGTPPLRDGSNSIYWFNYAANDPKNNLLGWHNDEYLGNWMHLYFTDRYRTQISNGVLISLDDYHYAYNQRFTGENHLRFLKKEMPRDVYEKNNPSGVSLYQRFALYELPEDQQQELQEDDLVIGENV